jgi:hypothetical protein
MDAITTGRRTEPEQRKNNLSNQLFGLSSVDQYDPAKVALMRDSIDRAVRYADAEQATAALKAAHRVGDTSLVKAIVSTAFEQVVRSHRGVHGPRARLVQRARRTPLDHQRP